MSANEDWRGAFKTMNVLATAPMDGVWFAALKGGAAEKCGGRWLMAKRYGLPR